LVGGDGVPDFVHFKGGGLSADKSEKGDNGQYYSCFHNKKS
jgi:hypothetical protein